MKIVASSSSSSPSFLLFPPRPPPQVDFIEVQFLSEKTHFRREPFKRFDKCMGTKLPLWSWHRTFSCLQKVPFCLLASWTAKALLSVPVNHFCFSRASCVWTCPSVCTVLGLPEHALELYPSCCMCHLSVVHSFIPFWIVPTVWICFNWWI